MYIIQKRQAVLFDTLLVQTFVFEEWTQLWEENKRR